jgi:adenylosuccinate lyase
MRANLESTQGVTSSGQVLLALMRRGLSRRKAYELVQRSALSAWRRQEPFVEVLLRDPKILRHLTPQAVRRCTDPHGHLRYVSRIFKRVGL